MMIIKKLSRYFQRIGVDHETDVQRQALSFDVQTPQGEWQCLILVDTQKRANNGIGFYSTLPSRVPSSLRNHMALFLMYLNSDRLFGSFELDPHTGDLHFKTYVDFESRPFSEKAVEQNMLFNISIMQQHMTKLTQMIHQENITRA